MFLTVEVIICCREGSYDTLAIIVEQKHTMEMQKSMCGQRREDSVKEWFHKRVVSELDSQQG